MSFSCPTYPVAGKEGTQQTHFSSQETFLYSEERDQAAIDCLCGGSVRNSRLLGSTKHGITLTKPRFSIHYNSAFVPVLQSFHSTFTIGKVRQLQGLSTPDLRVPMAKYLRIIASTIKLGWTSSESFPLLENRGKIPLNHCHFQKIRANGRIGLNFKGRKWIFMLFPLKYPWAKGFIYNFWKIILGLYIGKPF